jgi:cytoskeletal protein CcmA (bactofilin family)
MAMTLKKDEELVRTGEVNAVLGKGTEFEGKLTFEGEVRIAGKFTGEIFSKDRLQIDDGAKVHAEISAGSVIVYGEVVGNIKASQSVELRARLARGRDHVPAVRRILPRELEADAAVRSGDQDRWHAHSTRRRW